MIILQINLIGESIRSTSLLLTLFGAYGVSFLIILRVKLTGRCAIEVSPRTKINLTLAKLILIFHQTRLFSVSFFSSFFFLFLLSFLLYTMVFRSNEGSVPLKRGL